MEGRRRLLLAAAGLSLLGLAGGVALAVSLQQPIVAVFGVIVALAPWGALIDDVERRNRDRGSRD